MSTAPATVAVVTITGRTPVRHAAGCRHVKRSTTQGKPVSAPVNMTLADAYGSADYRDIPNPKDVAECLYDVTYPALYAASRS